MATRRDTQKVPQEIDTNQALQRQEQERDMARNINRLSLASKGFQDFCHALCLEFRKVMAFDYCIVVSRLGITGEYYTFLFDGERGVDSFHTGTELASVPERFFYEEASRSGQAVIRNNVQKNSNDGKLLLGRRNVTSYMLFPMVWNDTVVGCINMLSYSDFYFTEAHRDFVAQVLTQITLAVVNTMLAHRHSSDVTERCALEKKTFEYQYRLENLLKDKALKLSETERQMYNQKRFLDALVQSTNVYVVSITSDGKIKFINHAIEEKFGYTIKDVQGKSFVDVFVPHDKVEELHDVIQSLLIGSGGKQVEIPFAGRDSQIRNVLWDVTSFKDEQDALTNVNLFGYDVTERDMLREQLIQADKMSGLGTMISGVAHELNNPLSAIMNFSELMMMCENLPQSATERLRRIMDASQHCARIVENLLRFATKRKTVRNEEFICINDIIKDVLELKVHELKNNAIEVKRLFSQTLPRTMADRVQLMQVFINLINNAYHAMKHAHGRGTLTIRTFQTGQKIVVEFEDDGPGIQEPEKLFMPFYTTKEVGKGTGLGLAVSFGIMKEHGGTISGANSQKGAIFTVTLPVKEQRGGEVKLPMGKKDYDLKCLRVLLVEDEAGIAEACSELLQLKGCSVTSVSSAKEAIEAIRGAPFDIVIMDLKLSGEMSGIQLYEWMQNAATALRGKVILMTGDTVSPEARAFIANSSVAVLPKPFQLNALLETIEQVVKKERNGQA